MNDNWQIEGMKADEQGITSDWQFKQSLIDGVVVKEVKNVPNGYGYLTEIYRVDWQLDSEVVEQVFQSVLEPGSVSAWHAHQETTDRLFCAFGLVLVVLYDSRKDSPTYKTMNSFRVGAVRPAVISIPPKVWHGVMNVSHHVGLLVNVVDKAYCYESPDHLRLPEDSDEIPYRFDASTR